MQTDEPLTHEIMRQRAFELADTARYTGWADIAAALGYHPVLLRRIDDDAGFIAMVNVRCRLARERNAPRS